MTKVILGEINRSRVKPRQVWKTSLSVRKIALAGFCRRKDNRLRLM